MNTNFNKITNLTEINGFVKQFIAHVNEKNDRESHRNGIITISNFKDVSLKDMNLELTKFINQLDEYYPGLLKMSIIIEVPLIMKGMIKILFELFNEKIGKMTLIMKKEELVKFMNADIIPIGFGGVRKFKPKDLDKFKHLKQLAYIKFSKKAIRYIDSLEKDY